MILIAACSDDRSDASALARDAGDDGTVSVDGSPTDGPTPPPGCDPTADPKDAPKCVVSEFGVFVDATNGNDASSGTKESPVKTIGAAIGKLSGKNRLYICEGSYAEHVKLTSTVSLYGGFACGAWTYSGNKPIVAPSDVGYALEVQNAAGAIVVADVTFRAAAGTEASPSSIAAFVNASPSVTLRRVALEAGAGAKGTDQPKGAAGALASSMPTAGTLNGNNGTATVGGFAQLCTCAGGPTSKGGGGGNLNGDGSPGETAQAISDPTNATGGAGTGTDCGSGGTGKNGSNAPNATSGEGAKKPGDVADSGWLPESGKNGAAGPAGQGGGGGAGASGGGGSGGCGGCGGEGAKGGLGGGASIALLTINSPVTLGACTLTTADAGAGGAGGDGGDGIAGGTRGTGGGSACNGGNGGKGGNGGAGGGGAGGVSVGVLYKGAKPTVDATIATGNKGAAGVGPGGNNGIDGVKADTLEVQ